MAQKVTKAVIAAAGFGTRFLPQTKAMPKEMLPLVDKPIIQYVVEELVAVGITDIIIVSGYSKRSIEDHFDKPSQDLVANLKQGGPTKQHLLDEVVSIGEMANFAYIRQKGPYGNGTPVMNAEHLIGDEPFIYTWSDDFISASPLRFQQMIDAYQKYDCPVLSAISVTNDKDYDRYGFAGGDRLDDTMLDIKALVEKPGKAAAPSDMATVSGYLLTPDVFGYMRQAAASLKGDEELYSQNALKLMLQDNKRLLACKIANGTYHDAGDKLEYLKTVVDFALKRDDIGEEFLAYLKQKVC